MPQKNSFRLISVCLAGTLAALMCEGTAAQVTSAPPPDPNLTAPGRQAAHPPAVRQQLPPGAMAPAPSKQQISNGRVLGYVYWDADHFSHVPSSSCSGMAVTLSVGSTSGPFTAYTPVSTLNNNFKYVGPLKEFLTGGTIQTYGLCEYAFDHVPENVPLQVSLAVTHLTAFEPVVAPQISMLSPIQIIHAKCNMLPGTPVSLGDLTVHWSTCQDMAFNVNFAMVAAPRNPIPMAAQPPPPGPGAVPSTSQSGPLLNNKTSQGMLLATNPQVGNGGLLSQPKPAPGGAVQLNPQPIPPRTSANPGLAAPTAPERRTVARVLSPAQQSQKITNPKAGLQNSTIIAVLKHQSAAATAEASQMKLSLRPAGVQTQPSTVMSASTGGNMLLSASSAPSTGATRQTSPSGSTTSASRYASMSPGMIPGVALQCGRDSSMRILTVSGGPHPAVFTQDSTNNFNFYTITGCSLGNAGASAKVYIYHQGTFHEDFQIQLWSDNSIAVSLDSNLSGVDDQNDVTLVIQRNDGQQAVKTGNKFYAARNTVLLPMIPQKAFSLSQFRPDQSTVQSWKPTYTSASSASVVPNLPGLSAEVHWDITADPNGSVVGGKDDYDFSGLHSSFAVDSAVLEYRNLSCTDSTYNQLKTSSDKWSLDWYGNSGMQITWQAQVCTPNFNRCGGGPFVKNDCFTNAPESNYGVNVWVTGPRGLDPWTGKPVS